MSRSLTLGLLAPFAPIALTLGGCAATTATAPAPISTATEPTVFDAGMVSAADRRAADAGAEILRQGGTATDAAIATMLALNVVEPQSSGIGGGGFLLLADEQGHVESWDGRETAPKAATPSRFLDASGQPLPFRVAVIGGRSVGIPGNIAIAAKAHAAHGRLPWAQLFQPAIHLAREGFVLSPRGYTSLARSADTGAHDPQARAIFYGVDGKPLPQGTTIRNPALASTLEMLAAKGPAGFYKGELAREIAVKVAAETPSDGKMTVADIAAFTAKERPGVCAKYRIYKICSMGPPSSGATTVLATLVQLEDFDLAALGPDSPVAWHLIAESQRLAYADRELFLADPDFVSVPVKELLDPAYLHQRGALIAADRTMAKVTAGLPAPHLALGKGYEEHGTSHFVVIDRQGNAASWTSTVESAFGSGIMVGGFYLNNELTDFSFVPEKDGAKVANRVEGGKRPRSSMAPTLVYGPDGKLLLVVGAAGGATIPVQVIRALIGVLDWKLPVDKALALPVLFAPTDTINVEKGSRLEAMIPQLTALGHGSVKALEMPLKTNAVAVVDGRLVGAGDPRSEGVAVSQ
ncbi:gamma-glutamyltransferase [Novosphingobium sp. P6W]|uniref:gamma-glutamyltransferase n=1 Tax=Novosphingobium sp. P6W TaxID=1609758 RepID=UPI0005C2ED0F|nr:gamma-glutamyltransferase [Novosphingobium sp. P6W]AXB75253.1 gamma-glutamyltransferase [Novosphingobium sp. P6W]KIS32691.1 gamma-glutamyltranspeptidase [Novosphingobium sp. P6W]